MGTIHNLANRFRALNFEELKQAALIDTAPSVIPEMTEQQMRQGQRSDGEMIGYLHDAIYAQVKILNGGLAPPGEVDLRLNGGFQEGLRTSITPTAIRTFSIDWKAEKLEKWYGPLIYGANSANLAKYAKEDLLPNLMARLKAATTG